MKYLRGIAETMLVGIGKFIFPVEFIILDMPEDIKVPMILGRPFLSIAHAKIDVFKRKITLRVRDDKIIFKSVKLASSLFKTVYMLSLRERIELDLESRLMGETLLRRDQGDDLMPTIKEGEVIEKFRTRDDKLDTEIDDYLSYCDYDKKIHIDYKMVYKGNNIVGSLMNVPIFVGTFSIVTGFVVLEDIDSYRVKGMGDVIVGEPFLKEIKIKARRFDGMINIYNGNDELVVVVLVAALSPELVLVFAPLESSLSHLVLVSAPLGLYLVSAWVHVESVVGEGNWLILPITLQSTFSRGAGGSKRKPMSTVGTQKRQGKKKVRTSRFAKWFGLQDEPEQTQDEPQQTQHEPMQTQDKDQVEQTQEQDEIDLTQVEQTQELTQD
ncbi:homeodomain-like protein [Tanacetum coccineum]